jgi:RND family efflux transporter MFP subunit
MRNARVWIVVIPVLVAAVLIGGAVWRKAARVPVGPPPRGGAGSSAIPVETVPIERGPIENRRVFSGSLEAVSTVTLAPKIAGRVVSLPVDLADVVTRGQVIARLDGDELTQAVAQAQAELAVAEAGLAEASSAAEITRREHERVATLSERGIASESQLDTVRADLLSREAAVQVARAEVLRSTAALEAARIRLGYSTILAEWEDDGGARVVAQRFVEEGDTVSPNTPLVTVIALDPIKAVVFVAERDYAALAPGKPVTLSTDAHPGRVWEGQVSRVSPAFREGSRQARVEIDVANPDGALKPGMFARVGVVLGREANAVIVPLSAITQRDGVDVVFLVGGGEAEARMVPVKVGIRDGERVQVTGEGLEGRVVTLGQQLIGDGTRVVQTDPGDGG